MKSVLCFSLVLAGLLITPSVFANQALANAKGCMACHDMGAKKIGPSYKEVAQKYAGQKDAAPMLVKNILEGSSGTWGDMAMPASKTMGLTEADAKKLVDWILTQK
jgi:cytochrome c